MTVAILVFSFLAFAFSSIVMMPGMREPLFGINAKDVPIQRYAYNPPERKSIIVDADGLAHRTADLTHPTKRDRSRRTLVWDSTPSLNVVSGESSASASPQELSEPVRYISAGRLAKSRIVSDPELSRFTRSTLRVHSSAGRVKIWGHVLDQAEMARILQIAESAAGPGNVDNQMRVM